MEDFQTIQSVCYPKENKKLMEKLMKRTTIKEFLEINKNQIKKEFEILSMGSVRNPKSAYHCQQSKKNRYADILTFTHSRVIVPYIKEYYLNANYVKSVVDNKDFAIFSQAPVPESVEDFWAAAIYNKVSVIIMLCSLIDEKRGHQAEQYWPDPNKEIAFKSGLVVKTIQEKQIGQSYVERELELARGDEKMRIKQIHWTGWSDLREPLGQQSAVLFQNLVDICLKLIENNQLFIVHCSAGIGRTGTLGAMIQAQRCLQNSKQLSLFEIVLNLRNYRTGCVQTFDQYKFLYLQLQKNLQQS